MTHEEKTLVFQDLSCRLPYNMVLHTSLGDVILDNEHRNLGVIYYKEYSEEAKKRCNYDTNDFSIVISGCYFCCDLKPYLRPLSSMTEEEIEEWDTLCVMMRNMPLVSIPMVEKFVNSRHLDYRGLIGKGLALEAPDGMYKF